MPRFPDRRSAVDWGKEEEAEGGAIGEERKENLMVYVTRRIHRWKKSVYIRMRDPRRGRVSCAQPHAEPAAKMRE